MAATISKTLRTTAKGRGVSLRVLARESGVSPSVLSRFLRHERSLTLQTADKLAGALGLRLEGRPAE